MLKFTVRDLVHLFYNDNLDAVITPKDLMMILISIVPLFNEIYGNKIVLLPYGADNYGTIVVFHDSKNGNCRFFFDNAQGFLHTFNIDHA